MDGLVYHYMAATSLRLGSLTAANTFPLSAANAHPEGIADPPVEATLFAVAATYGVPSGPTNEVYRYQVGITGSAILDLTITDPSFDRTAGLAFSPRGELFVTNRGVTGTEGSVSRLLDPIGTPVPNGVISSSELDSPHGITFVENELLVANLLGASIARFGFDDDGNAVSTGVITEGLLNAMPNYLTVSPWGEIFLSQCCGANPINRYLFDENGAPVLNGIISSAGFENTSGLAFSPWGELFVADFYQRSISRFTFDDELNAWPNGKIATIGLDGPIGVAFSPWGELFVSNHIDDGKIGRWTFDDNHNAVPNGFISSPHALGQIAFSPAARPFIEVTSPRIGASFETGQD